MNSKKSTEWFYIGIACLAGIAVIVPIAIWGVPSGPDQAQHYQFAQTYYDSLINGDGFPSWSDKENAGYGGIGIRFYPPLAYYVLAFARILTGNWFDASWLTFMFWMILGCVGVYFWTRFWFPAKESAIAAVFYAIIPYHLNQLYISFIYADFAAASILVFCFAFLTRVMRRGSNSDVLSLSIAFTLLILTHLPTTIIGSICLGVYGIMLLQKKDFLRQLIKAFVAFFVGLTASAHYWVAMFKEIDWLNHATDKYSSNHYGFANRFYPLYFHRLEADVKESLIIPDILFGITTLFLATAVIYLFYRKFKTAEDDRVTQVFRLVLPLGLFGFLMTTSLSAPIWNLLPPLQKVQFPWRWFSIVAMCGAVVAAAAVHLLIKGKFLKQRTWSYAAVVLPLFLLLFNGLYFFNPGAFVPVDPAEFELEMSELPAKESCFCWWSIWSKQNALAVGEKVSAENRQVVVSDWQAEERNFTVEAGTATQARIATFYYPHWRAFVNGASIETGKDENGAILVPLPAEKATIQIVFQEPPLVRFASLISLTAWTFILFAAVFLWLTKPLKLKTPETYFAEENFRANFFL